MKKAISIILVCLFVLISSMALANPLKEFMGIEVTIYWGTYRQAPYVYIVDIIDEDWFIYKYAGKYHWGYVPNITAITIHNKNYVYSGESPW